MNIVIRTEILASDPQAGMKSQQAINIDFAGKKIESSFVTGKTHIGPITLSSARDTFEVSDASFSQNSVNFKVTGETASGVRILPNINYSFDINISDNGTGTISGSHDGYPAYFVRISERYIYSYRHQPMRIWKLFGSSDVVFGPTSF